MSLQNLHLSSHFGLVLRFISNQTIQFTPRGVVRDVTIYHDFATAVLRCCAKCCFGIDDNIVEAVQRA
jgi:hypothetical protein